MATKLPDSIRKRDILYSEATPAAELVEYGQVFLQHDRLWDAVEFFGNAKNEEGLRQVKEAGIEVGDAYLLRRIERLLEGAVQPQDWVRLGEQAWKMQKYQDALEGFSRGGDEERKALAAQKVAETGPKEELQLQVEEEPTQGAGQVADGEGAEGEPEDEN
jgi:hypothetical protein